MCCLRAARGFMPCVADYQLYLCQSVHSAYLEICLYTYAIALLSWSSCQYDTTDCLAQCRWHMRGIVMTDSGPQHHSLPVCQHTRRQALQTPVTPLAEAVSGQDNNFYSTTTHGSTGQCRNAATPQSLASRELASSCLLRG